MSKARWTFAVLIVVFLLARSAFGAEITQECGDLVRDIPGIGIPGRYCIFRTSGSHSQKVLHFLHGSGGNEFDWVAPGKHFRADILRNEWEALGVDAPVVIAISFSPSWSLVEDNVGINPQYLQRYLRSALPEVESKLGYQVSPADRLFVGMSMGGGNVAQLILKHPELMNRAALISPAIVDWDPSDSKFINHMVTQNGASLDLMEDYKSKMILKFPDTASWLNFSPLDLGSRFLGPKSPPMLIEVGTQDSWGFYKPSLAFSQIAQKMGAPVIFSGQDGGDHGNVDYKRLARFLSL